MKAVFYIFIFFINLTFAYSQESSLEDWIFNVKVQKVNNELVIYMSYDGNYPAGEVQGLPRGNIDGIDLEALSNFNIAVRWPSSLSLTLGNINNTAGLGISKSGGILSKNGYDYQIFYQSGSTFFYSNFIYDVDYEVFRIPINSQSGTGIVEIAPIGFLDFMPNIQIDYFKASAGLGGFPEIYDYFPPDIIGYITLPLTLTNFNVEKIIDKNSSLLTWSTSSEINSDYFNIERSLDGIKWETIGKVDAAGNSNRQNNYKFLDENLKLDREENIFFYRLKMFDLDGAYKYSEIRNILFANDKNIVQVFPNPTKDVFNLDLSVLDNNKGEITIIVIDQAGRNVLVKKEADNSLQTFSLKDLPVGNYNVIVKQNEDVYLNKIVKIK